MLATAAGQAAAHELCGLLHAMPGMRWSAAVLPYPLEDVDADLLLPVIGPGEGDGIAEAIRHRHGSRHGRVIPLLLSPSAEQLADLLAAGASDFLTMPLGAAALKVRLQRALGLLPAQPAPAAPAARLPSRKNLVGASPAFMKSLSMLPAIAGYEASVLVLGETGTGKEVYARAIHASSTRAGGPWIALNCGAVPTDLLESELFGHVRGAFTHAHAARAGLVREAEGGTLFLDEIDSLPLAAQSKLLRFVQEMEYRPVGADKTCRADVRIIAASNQDLPALADAGTFRPDLFFRLSVLTATLPPLRERREDIRELALHFIDHFCRRAGRAPLGLSFQALQRLLAYHWPGNVRELRHAIERAVLMCQGARLQPDDLHLRMRADAAPADESLGAAKARLIAQFEADYIRRLLLSTNGNITHAAKTAGKNRRAFFELMRKRGIDPMGFRPPQGSSFN